MSAPIGSLPTSVLGVPGTWALIGGTHCFEGGAREGWVVRAYYTRLAWNITVTRFAPYGKAIFSGPTIEEAQRRGLEDLATLVSLVAPAPVREEAAPASTVLLTVHLHRLAADAHQIIRDDDGELLGELTCDERLAQGIIDSINAAGARCEDCLGAAVVKYQGSALCAEHAADAGAAKCESCARLFDAEEEGVGSVGPDCLDFCGLCWAEMQAEDDAAAIAEQTAALADPTKALESPTPLGVVIDILGLACRYATLGDVAGWTKEQREAAVDWAAREHANAGVEEPPFSKAMEPPEHVAALPEVIGCESMRDHAAARLRFADGPEETRDERDFDEGLA